MGSFNADSGLLTGAGCGEARDVSSRSWTRLSPLPRPGGSPGMLRKLESQTIQIQWKKVHLRIYNHLRLGWRGQHEQETVLGRLHYKLRRTVQSNRQDRYIRLWIKDHCKLQY